MGYSIFDADKYFTACILVIAAFPVSAFLIALLIQLSYKA